MTRYEDCHIVPKYLQGTRDSSNMGRLTLPLHAFQHYLIGDSTIGNDRDANFWAVNAIKRRCTPEERQEADRLIALHNEDKRSKLP